MHPCPGCRKGWLALPGGAGGRRGSCPLRSFRLSPRSQGGPFLSEFSLGPKMTGRQFIQKCFVSFSTKKKKKTFLCSKSWRFLGRNRLGEGSTLGGRVGDVRTAGLIDGPGEKSAVADRQTDCPSPGNWMPPRSLAWKFGISGARPGWRRQRRPS